MVVAGLILIIACVNYVNLATARATARAKEVGVRKTFGADRRSLIVQFLGESYLLTLVSLLLSVALVLILLPAFNRMAGVEIPARALVEWTAGLGILGLGLAVGFLAGGYPALVLSAFQPASVMKNTFGAQTDRAAGSCSATL